MPTDTERLEWVAETRSNLAFSDYVATCTVPGGGRGTTYWHPPKGHESEGDGLPSRADAMRRSIDVMMKRRTPVDGEANAK